MTESTSDRRKVLAAGSAVLMAGLAGCAAFRDTKGVPGDKEPEPVDSQGHPVDPLANAQPPQDDQSNENETGNETSE
jgi:hypothetical protein